MDASRIPASPPPPRPRGPRPVFLAVVAVGCALLLILAISAYVVLVPMGRPALVRHVEVLGHGMKDLEIPIMTLYTAPPITGARVDSSVSWAIASTHLGPSTTYRFQWSPTSQGTLPVRFVLNSTFSDLDGGGRVFSAIDNGFLYYPAGTCGAGCTRIGTETGLGGAGIQHVVYEKWQLRYAVLNVTEVLGPSRTSFLEVEFSFVRSGSVGSPMPAANISRPGPDDLAALFIARVEAGGTIGLSVQGLTAVPNLFRNRVTTVAFDAGRLGSLSARLDSQYNWSSADDYRLSFSASTNATIQFSIDLRFGSLLIDNVATG